MAPAIDPYAQVATALAAELAGLVVPAGPPRRVLEHPAAEVIDAAARPIRDQLAQLGRGGTSPSYVLSLVNGLVHGIGTTLFAAGAPHPTWRRWLALAAVVDHLTGAWISAAISGALAGEWDFVDAIDDTREAFSPDTGALWHLLGKRPRVDLGAVDGDPIDLAIWQALIDAHDAGDPARVEHAFWRAVDRAIESDPWIAGDRIRTGDPRDETFLPFAWSPTSDAGVAAAIAAVLVRQGLPIAARMGEARRRFLEPGLAPGASWLGAARFVAASTSASAPPSAPGDQ